MLPRLPVCLRCGISIGTPFGSPPLSKFYVLNTENMQKKMRWKKLILSFFHPFVFIFLFPTDKKAGRRSNR